MANTKKIFCVYWHRGMNSGIYTFDTLAAATYCAAEFSEMDDMYRVSIFETKEITVVKDVKE